MKRLLLLLLFSMPLFSLEVDIDLLEESGYRVVEFENYVGPYDFYNSVEEIRSIGSYLASNTLLGKSSEANYNGKYLLYHRPKLEWEKKRSGDVLFISNMALVDNIENVKLIVSQYLIDKYGYSLEDSLLLSQLIVIYNAIYRGDSDHFIDTYTGESFVTTNTEYLGIDKNYYNWPGKSYIYIPLDDKIRLGDLSTVDSDLFIEEKVIDHIREESDESIEIREDVIEFKEREIEEDIIRLQEEEEVILEEIESIESEIATLNIYEEPEKEKIQTLESEKEILKETLEETRKEKEEVKEKEEKVLKIRDDVAEDKNLEIEEKVDLVHGILFLRNKDVKGNSMGQFIKLDSEGSVIGESEINTVRNNNFIVEDKKIFAIAGDNERNHKISLVAVNRDNLETDSLGGIPCYIDSVIIYEGSNIFVVIQEGNSYYIGMFDYNLTFKGRSPVEVNKDTYISVKDSRLYIQGTDNSLKWVNLSDFISE